MNDITFIFWYWWVLAFVFLILEMLVPSFFFLWLGVAGLLTGLNALITNNLPEQILCFSLVSIVLLFSWKFYQKNHAKAKSAIKKTDQPFLNKRGAQYVGQVFSVYEPIKDGRGKIQIGDSLWAVRGEDCDAGDKVKVVTCCSMVFEVEKVI